MVSGGGMSDGGGSGTMRTFSEGSSDMADKPNGIRADLDPTQCSGLPDDREIVGFRPERTSGALQAKVATQRAWSLSSASGGSSSYAPWSRSASLKIAVSTSTRRRRSVTRM